ncbi:hypothetical protein BDW22DRAFT_956886 [Trametopsis cervina]|nr:hypothetical protein BDW22DRAFT_956886 [Trametopsis cervina]
MMSLVSAVKFMAAVALKDQPVFGLITRGSIGKLILAWMNSDTDKKYDGLVCVLTLSVNKFDLAEPIDALRFAAFLQRLRKFHEDRMAGIQGRLREFFETHDGGESLDWMAKAHTEKIRNALVASGFEWSPDDETEASTRHESRYLRDVDDVSDDELDKAWQNSRKPSWQFFPDFDDENTDNDDSEESQHDESERLDASSENENENGGVDAGDSDNSYGGGDQDQGYNDGDCGSENTVATESDQNNDD